MQIETRNLGLTDSGQLDLEVARAFGAALDRFDERIRRVRVRLIPAGAHEAACRVRVWCGNGPTVVMEAQAASGNEAIHAVADNLNRALRRRWSTRRSRLRRADDRRSSSTSAFRKELS